jgi:uncharacterized protein
MLISRRICGILACVAVGTFVPAGAQALDPKAAPEAGKPLHLFKDPVAALRQGIESFRRGEKEESIPALRYAAEGGQTRAQWQLGKMYASGQGVERNDRTAYNYFMGIVREYRDDQFDPLQQSMVSDAFVALGVYNLNGIPNTDIKRNVNRAYRMFQFAATAFGNPDAQYNLARMFLDGEGVEKNARQAIRWLYQAANKSHVESTAVLGNMLFHGAPGVGAQRARGLMYLTLARDAAGPSGAQKYKWVLDLHSRAMEQANDVDKEGAHVELRNFLSRGRR